MKQEQIEERISETEITMIELFSHGYSADDVAKKIFLSRRTVETYLSRLRFVFNCRNTTELVAEFIRKKLIK
jgi:two-component system vancomycin resistance associated response regulator VraR